MNGEERADGGGPTDGAEGSVDANSETGSDLVMRHGSARRPDRPPTRVRPAGFTDEDVATLGKLSEALEVVEHARGLLYGFHRLCGTADLALQEAVRLLRAAGQSPLADQLDQMLVGRDVIAGMWSYQLVEAYDAGYWSVFRDAETHARRILAEAHGTAGHHLRYLFEAEMQHREQHQKNATHDEEWSTG